MHEAGPGMFNSAFRMNLIPVLLLLGCFVAQVAHAGDFARTQVLGTSADGRFVAVEEYGVQDGSGFPYSNLFVLDLQTDRWVKGSPARVRVDDETAAVDTARRQARSKLQKIFASLGLQDRGDVVLLAANPGTEHGADPHRLGFDTGRFVPQIHRPALLSLTELPFDNPQCPDPQIKGFSLVIEINDTVRQLNRDTKIPASRRCPLRYRILAAHTVSPPGGTAYLLITIQYESFGFEGPDGRHLFIGMPL